MSRLTLRQRWHLLRWEWSHRLWQEENRRALVRLLVERVALDEGLSALERDLDRPAWHEVVDLLDGLDLARYEGSEVQRQGQAIEEIVRLRR